MTSAKFSGFLTPPPSPCQHFGPIYSTKITQPMSDFWYPPPSPSPLTSFVNGPKGIFILMQVKKSWVKYCMRHMRS